MRVQRVLETCLYVDNLDAARAFYEDVLGLAFVSCREGRHVFFRCGEGMLLIFEPAASDADDSEVPRHGAHGAGHVAFAVPADELADWRDRLAEHGVAIEAEVDWPNGVRSVYFRDPAGNSLELTSCRLWGFAEPAGADSGPDG